MLNRLKVVFFSETTNIYLIKKSESEGQENENPVGLLLSWTPESSPLDRLAVFDAPESLPLVRVAVSGAPESSNPCGLRLSGGSESSNPGGAELSCLRGRRFFYRKEESYSFFITFTAGSELFRPSDIFENKALCFFCLWKPEKFSLYAKTAQRPSRIRAWGCCLFAYKGFSGPP